MQIYCFFSETQTLPTYKIKNKTQYFDADETKQNGTIALTLSKDEEAQYIIALDENCILNEDNLLDKNGEMDVNYIVDRFEKCFGISMRSSIHQEKVNEYVKLHKNDKRVVDKILKNNDVYKNFHKARGRKKDMNMS